MIPTYQINKSWQLGRLKVRFSKRGPSGMGRFGAGWNYKIGVQWSSWRYVYFSLLVAELFVSFEKKGKK